MSATRSHISYPKQYLYRRIVQAKLFIDSRYAENIVLDRMADEAYFSKFHFMRLFKKCYGHTPHQYLTAVRIEKAKQLLAQNKPVTEVCLTIGFDSVGSFSALFKRKTGHTPSEYQQRQQKRNAHIEKEPMHFVPGCFAQMHGWKSA